MKRLIQLIKFNIRFWKTYPDRECGYVELIKQEK